MALAGMFAVAAFVAAPVQTEAAAINLTFDCVGDSGPTSPSCGNLESAFGLTVSEVGANGILFTINHSAISGNSGEITNVYFDTPGNEWDSGANPFSNNQGNYTITNGSGVKFVPDTSPDNPIDNAVSPNFRSTYEGQECTSGSGCTSSSGVNAGEWVSFQFTLKPSFTWNNILTALSNQQLRIGLYIDGLNPGEWWQFGTKQNAQFVNNKYTAPSTPTDPTNPTPVPEPASLILFGSGLAGLAGLARKRRASRQAQQ